MSALGTLTLRRPQIWGRFQRLNHRPLPLRPKTLEEAWQMGLKAGYALGMVDGVNLGMEVGAYVTTDGTGTADPLDFV